MTTGCTTERYYRSYYRANCECTVASELRRRVHNLDSGGRTRGSVLSMRQRLRGVNRNVSQAFCSVVSHSRMCSSCLLAAVADHGCDQVSAQWGV